jgi:hypothetical protein
MKEAQVRLLLAMSLALLLSGCSAKKVLAPSPAGPTTLIVTRDSTTQDVSVYSLTDGASSAVLLLNTGPDGYGAVPLADGGIQYAKQHFDGAAWHNTMWKWDGHSSVQITYDPKWNRGAPARDRDGATYTADETGVTRYDAKGDSARIEPVQTGAYEDQGFYIADAPGEGVAYAVTPGHIVWKFDFLANRATGYTSGWDLDAAVMMPNNKLMLGSPKYGIVLNSTPVAVLPRGQGPIQLARLR